MTLYIRSLLSNKKYRKLLIQLLYKMTRKRFRDEMDNFLSKFDKDDIVFYNNIQKYVKHSAYSNSETVISEIDKIRALSRQRHLFSYLEFRRKHISSYLDIGSNNGLITGQIGKSLGLNKESIHGIDIGDFYGTLTNLAQNVTYKTYNGYNIPYEDDAFDLITAFQVLHHVSKLEELMTDIKRVLRKGGYLFIREHDLIDEQHRVIIDMEHVIYDIGDKGKFDEGFLRKYYAKYLRKDEWESLLGKYGFIKVNVNNKHVNRIKNKLLTNNPTKYYYELFQLNK